MRACDGLAAYVTFLDSAGPSVRAVTSGYVVTLGTIGGIVSTWVVSSPCDASAS